MTPTAVRLRAEPSVDDKRERVVGQPGLGLRGLALVIPIAVLLSIGAGSLESSVVVLAPLVSFALPVVAMVAFWWDDWPGTRLRASWSGWGDTVLIVVAGIVLTGAGQAVAGHLDLRGIFDPTPGPGHVPTFPHTLVLAGAAFVAMLEVTLVSERWPLRRIPAPTGAMALAISWAIALVLYCTLVAVHPAAGSGLVDRSGPVDGQDLGAVLVLIGALQVWLFVAWRGWPFSGIDRRWLRLSVANVLVIGGGVLTYAVAHDVGGVGPARLSAVAGSFVAAGLVLGMLLDGWLSRARLSPAHERLATLGGIVLLAAALAVLLTAVADGRHFSRASADEWVSYVGLDAIGTSVILHVAIGRRWPFGRTGTP